MSTAETFRAQTGKRKFSAPFVEDETTWILDCQGHQWGWVVEEGAPEWICFTDDYDAFVIEVKQDKRVKRADPLTSRERIGLDIAEQVAICRSWAQRDDRLADEETREKAHAFAKLDRLCAQREALPA